MRRRNIAVSLLAALVLFAVWVPAWAGARVALIIGNNAYVHAPALANPINDARAVAATLRGAGFEVLEYYDADRKALDGALEAFAALTPGADIGLVYYAGHGIQVEGASYLVPTDISLENDRDLRRLVPADYFLQDAARAATLGLVILDACRDNPFVRRVAEASGATRSMVVGRGLGRISDVPNNTMIAYATQSGNIALDGTGAGNSPYAQALVHHLGAAETDIRLVFGAVRDEVLQATGRQQEPFTYGSLGGQPIYLNPGTGVVDTDGGPAPAVETISYVPVVELETSGTLDSAYAAWTSAVSHGSWPQIASLSQRQDESMFPHLATLLARLQMSAPQITVADAVTVLRAKSLDVASLDGALARVIQAQLRDLNYYGGTLDGRVGPATRSAFSAYVAERAQGSFTYAALFDLAIDASTRRVTSDLTGRWSGHYFYPQPVNGISAVAFEMDLTFSQGRVSGYVSEPNTFGQKTSANLYATFEGSVAGTEVAWIKTYDGTAGVEHSVRYEGTLDRRSRTIQGRWIISSDWSGAFEIALQ
jgi:hypothetical protein